MGKYFFEVNTVVLLEFSATPIKVRQVCVGNTEVQLTKKTLLLCLSGLSRRDGQLFVCFMEYWIVLYGKVKLETVNFVRGQC